MSIDNLFFFNAGIIVSALLFILATYISVAIGNRDKHDKRKNEDIES